MAGIENHDYLVSLTEAKIENSLEQRQKEVVKDLRKNITAQEYEEFLELQTLKKSDTMEFLKRRVRRFKAILDITKNDFIRGQVGFLLERAEENIASFQKSQEDQEDRKTVSMYKEAETFIHKELALTLGPVWFKKIWWSLKFMLRRAVSGWFSPQNKAVDVELSKEELDRALSIVESDRNTGKPSYLGEASFHHIEAGGFLRRKECCGKRKILRVKVFYKRYSGKINRGADHHVCIVCLTHRADTDYMF